MVQDDEKLRADVIAQLEVIAFAQPSAFLKVDAQGQLRSNLTNCSPAQLAALKEFRLVIRQTPGQGSARETQFGFKMQDKSWALDKLFKLLGMDNTPKKKKKRNRL